jgi:hypothetical protein
MLSAAYAECLILSVTCKPYLLSVVMLSVIMLNVVMLGVVMLGVIMLSVAAPRKKSYSTFFQCIQLFYDVCLS